MKFTNRIPSCAIGAALFLSGTAWAAQPVTILNPGFEADVLADGNSVLTQSLSNWTGGYASASDTPAYSVWVDFAGDSGASNPDLAGNYVGAVPEGNNAAFAVTFTDFRQGIRQILAETVQADASYDLSVKVGNPDVTNSGGAGPGYVIEIVVNGTVVASAAAAAPASGTFVTVPVNYLAPSAGDPKVGQPIEIRLLVADDAVSGLRLDFDDVTLTRALTNPIANAGGPYTVSTGGSLTLNGSASQPSEGETITTYEWDLDDDGDFDEAITGATPTPISDVLLKGTYGMSLGGNTIKLKVTDSASKTAVTEVAVNLLPSAAVVYEPFNYPGTALNGASGASEVGLTGTWNASADSKLGPNRAFGPLVTRGTGIGDLQTGVNRYGGARAVSSSALDGNDLLDDGATLWFSVIIGYDTGGNVTNSRLAFALANSNFNTGNNQYNIPNVGLQIGSGLGVVLGGSGVGNGRIAATEFKNTGGVVAPPTANPTIGTLSSVLYGAGQSGLIVGKITWGAVSDTIELYVPDSNLNLGSAISTKTVAVDQTTYDTITWARGDKVVLDEIRFGANYAAVIETGSAWDLNGDTAGAGSTTPSGTWNSDANWNFAPDGTLVPIPWQPGTVATFSAGNDATGAYNITVDGTQDIGGLLFEDGTVNVSGGTALRMTANSTVAVAPALTATIATPITESTAGLQFAKAGTGKLVLSGNNVAATGGMNLAAGVTQFESPAAINGTARNVAIGSSGTMMLGSGFGAGNIPAALLDRVTASSPGVIATDNYASADFDFSTAGLTAASLGAVGNVNYSGTLTPNGTTYRVGGGGGTITMANANAITGSTSLIVNGNTTLAENNDYTGLTTINANSTLTIQGTSATSSVSLNTPNTTLILGNNDSLGAGTLTVQNSFAGPGTLAALGTVVTTNPVAANTDFNFGGTGSLTIGTVTVTGTRTITNNNTANVSTIASITSTASSPLTFAGNGSTTVAGTIGGGAGITTITKSGDGTLTLNGASTHNGNTTVSGGTLKVGNSTALGYGAPQTTSTPSTTVSSGFTLDLNGTVGINERITVSGTGIGANGALVNNSGTPAGIGSGIAGAAVATTGTGSGYSTPPTVEISGTGSGATANASMGLTSSSFTVNVSGDRVYTVNPTITLAGGGGSGATATPLMSANKVIGLTITAAGTGYTAAPTATVSGGTSTGTTTTTFTGNATNFCVGGLTMTAAGSGYTGTPSFTFNGTPQAVTTTLSSVALGAATSIGGTGDLTIDAVVSGAQALTKVGAGTVTLAGINTYSGSGGTTIGAGTLKLGVNNALPATAVSIGSAALDAATFTDTTIGNLDVTGTATINLGSGAALAFAASSGVDWTGGTLNVTGTLGATSLRFGTTNGGLLPAQLALISVNGSGLGTYSLDDSGYLIAPAGGDTYSDWATSNSITGGETGDSDNDGVKNLIEYALVDGGERGVLTGNTITFTKRGEPYGSDLTYVIETSESLGTGSWTDEVTHGPELLLSNPAISYTFTPGTPVKKFARLKIVTTP